LHRSIAFVGPVVVGIGMAILSGPGRASAECGGIDIEVLSNRADLISGGDALVEIVLPPGVGIAGLHVRVGSRDVTSAFALRDNGRVLGIVDGLSVGGNLLTATRYADDPGCQIPITNHPIGGPVFAGPQVQPWVCSTAANGLGPPQDAQCNAPTAYRYQYRSLAGAFAAYDPANPPLDVATTTTDTGATVPYIVRIERGTIDRGIYDVAVLWNPAQGWAPWAPQAGWNGKLMVLFGGDTNSHYSQPPPAEGIPGVAEGVLDDNALSRGFMVVSQGLNIHGENDNDTVSAEALMMVKEHIAETYGPIRHTIGEGCSGGGLQQQIIAATYPGLLDGILPTCSYPDIWTTAMEVGDCVAMNNYFGNDGTSEPNPLWPAAQQALVEGHSSNSTCIAWDQLFGSRFDPSAAANCNLPAEQVYDPQSNPAGTRCTIPDYQIAIWGERPPEVWTPAEQQIGRGFARRPVGNEGVEYGLAALLAGEILPEQFVDLNEKIGSFDIDGNPIPQRIRTDPGSAAIAYRAGQVTDPRVLARTPIIDLRGHDDQEIHTDDWSYVIRARLDAANGHHANQVIFRGAEPIVGDPAFACAGGFAAGLGGSGPPATPKESCTANPLVMMDRWLTAIEADATSDPPEVKVVRNKPPEAVDTCFIDGAPVTDPTACAAAFPYFSNTRIAAGGPPTHDIIQCQLKPLLREDYAGIPVPFTDAQWTRLQAVFPNGVCDWSRPGEGEQPSQAWMSFANGPGGQPLPAPPVAMPEPHALAGLVLGFGLITALRSRRGSGSAARPRPVSPRAPRA
jgi:hypothetical protein